MLPGDVAQLIAGTQGTPEQVAAIREQMGLNQPLPAQYFDWIGGVLRGDLGSSLLTGSSVAPNSPQKAQVTVPLGIMALVIAVMFSVPLGVLSAMRRGARRRHRALRRRAGPRRRAGGLGRHDARRRVRGLARLAARAGLSPHRLVDPVARLPSLLLPALTIGIVEGAMLLRFVRSATLQAVGQDYVRTAAAKGLTRNQALIRHGLPNVGLSVITVLGLQVAGIIVGAVIIEQLFTLPGIGRMLVADVGARDLVKVQGELLVLTGFVLVVGFVVDLLHRVIDPRQREAS